MNSFKNGQLRKHARIRLERRPHTRLDWLGIAIIISAAFIAVNFVLQEKYLLDQAYALQNLLGQEQFDAIRGTIQRGR